GANWTPLTIAVAEFCRPHTMLYTPGLIAGCRCTRHVDEEAMNPDLARLQPYPFEKLGHLKQDVTPPADLPHIALSIGEPKHPAPAFVAETLVSELRHLSTYPSTLGMPELREAIASWATRRFQLKPGSLSAAKQVLPVNGTREALFSFVQAVVDRSNKPLVLMPNPFYQIYEGAAFLAGAEPWFLPC